MADHPSFLEQLPPIAVAIWLGATPSYRVLEPDADDGKDWPAAGDSADLMLPSGEIHQTSIPEETPVRNFLLKVCRDQLLKRGRRAFHGISRFAAPIQSEDILIHAVPKGTSASISTIHLSSGKTDSSGLRVRTTAERIRIVTRESPGTLLVREVPCLADGVSDYQFEVYASRTTPDAPLSLDVVPAPSLASAYFHYVHVGMLQGAGAVGRRILNKLSKTGSTLDPFSILAAAVHCSTLGTHADIEKYTAIEQRLVTAVSSAHAVGELKLLGIIIRQKAKGAPADGVDLKSLLSISPLNLPLVSSTLFDARDIVARSTVGKGDISDASKWLDRYFDWSAEIGIDGPEISFRSRSWEQPGIQTTDGSDAWSEAKKNLTPLAVSPALAAARPATAPGAKASPRLFRPVEPEPARAAARSQPSERSERGERGDRGRGRRREAGDDREQSEIVDKLVAINRVAKVVKGGKNFAFAALVVVGDQKGRIGYGHGKAREVPEAIRKATEEAKKSMIRVPLREGRTLHHDTHGRWGAGKVLMRSAPPGTGVIAGGPMRAIFDVLGIRDVVAKSTGSSNPYNMVRATIDALKQQASPRAIASKRGLKVQDIIGKRDKSASRASEAG